MSDAAPENAPETPAAAPEAPETNGKKKPVRKPLWVAVPTNIDNLAYVDPVIPEPPEADEDGKKPNVEIVQMGAEYRLYVVPAGPGQKKALNAILAKHNVDLRNIGRVRMFAGDKPFGIEPQYNIRWI